MLKHSFVKVIPAFALFVAACGAPATPTVNVDDDDVNVTDPVITLEDQTISVDEDGVLEVSVKATVEPADAGEVVITIDKEPAHGTLTGSAGVFTYTPEADYNGADEATVSAKVGEKSVTATIKITVNPVNDTPSFAAGADVTVLENSPAYAAAWATALSAGPADESSQTLTFVVSNDNSALFSVQPAVSNTGELTFTPAVNAFGVANVSVSIQDSGDGENTSAVHTLVITLDNINSAPTFTKGANQTRLEDSGTITVAGWATGISAGPGEESQTLAFIVSNNNNALFATQPTISTDGTLTYRFADNAVGSAFVSVRLKDNGGTSNGGSDTSALQTFEITSTAVNDAPSMVTGGTVTVAEDSGNYSSTWATSLSAGTGPSEGTLNTPVVTNDNNALFLTQPSLTTGGVLAFRPAPSAFGAAELTITLSDTGGTANGGVNTATYNARIVVLPVNDKPSFTLSSTTISLTEDQGNAGLISEDALIASVLTGPANEAAQAVTWVVENNNPALFIGVPYIENNNLYLRLVTDASGTAELTIRVQDDGGTANGGFDLSDSSVVTVNVAAVNDAPVAVDDEGSLATISGHPLEVDVLANDSDVEGDDLSVISVTQPAEGTVVILNGGASVEFTPAFDQIGAATFTYTVSDGDLTSVGTVTVNVSADTVAPALASTNVIDGALLNYDGAFGAEGVLDPATFVFDDYNINLGLTDVEVTFNGSALPTMAYAIDISTPRTMTVAISPGFVVPVAADGDELVISLTNVRDTAGNVGSNVVRTVTLDQIQPSFFWIELHGSRSTRAILKSNEALAAASLSAFSFHDDTANEAVAVEPLNGSGLLSIDQTNDTFYFVPRDLLVVGHDYTVDAAGLTDLAGNTPNSFLAHNFTVCCDEGAAPVARIEFLDPADDSVVGVVYANALTNDAFMLPATYAGGNYDVRVVFSGTLDGDNLWAHFRAESEMGDGDSFDGVTESVDAAYDAVRFSGIDADPGFTWQEGILYQLEVNAQMAAGSFFSLRLQTALRKSTDDGVAPSIYSVTGNGGEGTMPYVERGGSLFAAFSEPIDLTSLDVSNISLVNSSTFEAFDVQFTYDSENNGLTIWPVAGGKPVLLPIGAYTLNMSGVADRSTPARVMAMESKPFAVVASSAPVAFELERLTPDDLSTQVAPNTSISLYFSSPVSLGSLVDTGPSLAARGFRFEEKVGGTFIPRKGLSMQSYDRNQAAAGRMTVIDLASRDGGIHAEREYRLTLLPGLTDVYGNSLTGASSLVAKTFATGTTTDVKPTYLAPRVEIEVVGAAINMEGQPMTNAGRFNISYYDPDDGPWTYQVLNADTFASETAVDSQSYFEIELDAAGLDAIVAEGVETLFIHSISDANFNTSRAYSKVYRIPAATAVEAEPFVTQLDPVANPGWFEVEGTITGTVADLVKQVGIYIVIVDTSAVPAEIVGMAHRSVANLERYPGSLTFTGGNAVDNQLPELSGDLRYVAVADLRVPQGYTRGEDFSYAISLQSDPFNPDFP